MNNLLKKLASETAIYGLSHSLGKFINVLLIVLYTSENVFTVAQFGNLSVYYSVVGLAIVLLMYGMETAFFNFSRFEDSPKVFATAQQSIVATTGVFIVLGLFFNQRIANFLEYPDQGRFVQIFVFILALDALSTLPFARLRLEGRAKYFGLLKLLNIVVNVVFNIIFLWVMPKLQAAGYDVPFYNPDFGIGYVFVANMLASLTTFVITLPQWSGIKSKPNKELLVKMINYSRPLILVGLAGIVNETIDRLLLKKILPADISDYEIGVYSAFYRISIVMTLFVQAFRMAAEPFFFEQSKNEDAKYIYAQVLHYFTIVTSSIFLITAIFAKQIASVLIRQSGFFDHPHWMYLIPILLMANLFLGMMYNLNIWYKLNDKNKIGRNISILGALATLLFNLILIPLIGILGSAITTFLVYFGMAVTSYIYGQKHYPIPYKVKLIAFYIITSLVFYLVYLLLSYLLPSIAILLGLMMITLFGLTVYWVERPTKKL